MAGLRSVDNSIIKQLTSMIDRSRMGQSYLNTTVYRLYQNRQNQRWMTNNESEGSTWKELTPRYKSYKIKKFASFPGGGRKIMIATGRLKSAVVGPSSEHRKVATNTKLIVGWTTPYAVYTEDIRPVNVWDDAQNKQMYDDYAAYMMRGTIRSILGGG